MDHVTTERSTSVARASRSVLFLHGFLGGASSWDAVRSELPRHVRCDSLTLLGHARVRDEAESRVTTFVDEVERLAAKIDATPGLDTLVGYSLGARVALGVASRVKRPLARLVMVSGRDGLGASDEAGARRDLDDALADALLERGLPAFVDRWQALPLFASQSALPEALRAEHRARRLAHDPDAVARALRVLSLGRMPRFGREAVSRTARIDLVTGALDTKFTELAHRFAEDHGRLGDVRVHVIANAGHDVVLEQPGALAAILEDRA